MVVPRTNKYLYKRSLYPVMTLAGSGSLSIPEARRYAPTGATSTCLALPFPRIGIRTGLPSQPLPDLGQSRDSGLRRESALRSEPQFCDCARSHQSNRGSKRPRRHMLTLGVSADPSKWMCAMRAQCKEELEEQLIRSLPFGVARPPKLTPYLVELAGPEC